MATMALRYFLFLSLACTAYVSGDCFAPTAAFRFRQFTYLIDGNNVVMLFYDFKESWAGTMEEAVGLSGDIKAAGVMTSSGHPFFNIGNEMLMYDENLSPINQDLSPINQDLSPINQDLSHINQDLSPINPDEAKDWGPFFKTGIDAASELRGINYYFKHCSYVKESSTSIYDVTDLGIPVCDVDAAFNHDDDMYVIKGGEYWVIDASKVTLGPRPLKDLVTLTSTSLCEKSLTYEEKVKAEKKYEAENKCVIIDAAFKDDFDNVVYLLNHDEYIALPNFVESKKRPISDSKWGVASGRIDAVAVYPPLSGLPYFFQRSHFFSFSHPNVADGPFDNSQWSPFIADGFDAAGRANGETYFFKHCQILNDDSGQVRNLVELGFPCDLDAAYSVNGILHAIRADQVWVWEGGDHEASGPYPLTDFLKFTSWSVCPSKTVVAPTISLKQKGHIYGRTR